MLQRDDKTFETHDGLKLHFQCFKPTQEPKAVLIFVHGLNEHLGRYSYPVEYFSKDYKLYLFDFRGHGLSEGRRSYADKFTDLVEDLATFVEFVKEQEQGHKIFLVAHSMGGQVALNYLATHQPKGLSGFITSSPNIRIAFPLNAFERFGGRILSRVFPRVMFPNHVSEHDLSRDPEAAKKYADDELVNSKVTARLGVEIVRNQENVIMQYPPMIDLPAFMMHSGEDRVCDPKASEEFFEKLASRDKTLKIYEGAYHELFNEINRQEVFADMDTWLRNHL